VVRERLFGKVTLERRTRDAEGVRLTEI
jgi:hypothetical protein